MIVFEYWVNESTGTWHLADSATGWPTRTLCGLRTETLSSQDESAGGSRVTCRRCNQLRHAILGD
jgi:hypothetical protein